MTIRIAMWSGPRNLSTAMMRAFENRADCVVSDEPFYAAYLATTGLDHPMRDEIIAANDSDWDSLVAKCLAPAARPVFYQKHMTHHMLPGFGRCAGFSTSRWKIHGWVEFQAFLRRTTGKASVMAVANGSR